MCGECFIIQMCPPCSLLLAATWTTKEPDELKTGHWNRGTVIGQGSISHSQLYRDAESRTLLIQFHGSFCTVTILEFELKGKQTLDRVWRSLIGISLSINFFLLK